MTLVIVVGGVALGVSTLTGRSTPPVGEVAGAVATPEPAAPTPTTAPDAAIPSPLAGDPSPAAQAALVHDAPDERPPAQHGPDPASLTGYRWPLPNGRVTLPFGPTPWGGWFVSGDRIHDGIDLATFCNDRIVAAHDGVVVAAGRHFDDQIGWVGSLRRYYARLDAKHLWATLPIVVIVDDGNGYRSIYAHMWKIVVKKGQTLKAGQLLGYEGRTGRASGCHLHYGLFSPDERSTFTTDPGVVKRMKLPSAEIARIDPLLVLPHRSKPKPTASPTAKP